MNDTLRALLGFNNHYKMVATLSWLFGLGWDCYFILHGAPYSFILSWTGLTFAVSYGLKGLTAWFGRQGAASDTTAIANEASKQIEARRNGDHEATE